MSAGATAEGQVSATVTRSEASDPASESEGTSHVRMQPDAEPEEHSAEGVPSESPASSPATGAGIASSSTQSEDGPEGNEGRPAPVPASIPDPTMGCGHSIYDVVSSDEGTSYCAACASNPAKERP